MPPTPDNEIGYVALFGYRGSQARTMTITKNEGVTGVTGGPPWLLSPKSGIAGCQDTARAPSLDACAAVALQLCAPGGLALSTGKAPNAAPGCRHQIPPAPAACGSLPTRRTTL